MKRKFGSRITIFYFTGDCALHYTRRYYVACLFGIRTKTYNNTSGIWMRRSVVSSFPMFVSKNRFVKVTYKLKNWHHLNNQRNRDFVIEENSRRIVCMHVCTLAVKTGEEKQWNVILVWKAEVVFYVFIFYRNLFTFLSTMFHNFRAFLSSLSFTTTRRCSFSVLFR